MANKEVLKEYLIGKNGYLKNSDNNSKVIMLSGKWGSGKTHFWQKEIMKDLSDEKNRIPNHYISLYGKTSIQEIKDEIFIEIFKSVDSFEIEEKSKKLAKNTLDIASSLSKSISIFGINVDLSKLSEKPFEKLDEILENKKLKKTEEYLNRGGIICFDDFERKSKDIDLNDLFGFITQLSLNFKCKIVIILNDDVFEGEEKDIFSSVKEKTVSKYLYYNPSIKELFDLIFDDKENKKYEKLEKYRELIFKTLKETEELNARIYIQVLDNLLEWIDKVNKDEKGNEVLRCLILVNINFIKNHLVFKYENKLKLPTIFRELKSFPINSINIFENNIDNDFYDVNYELEVIEILKAAAESKYKKDNKAKENLIKDLNQIEKYGKYFWIFFKYYKIYKYKENISMGQLEKINSFIETGILIKENN